MSDALVAVDAGRTLRQELLVHRADELLLFRDDLFAEHVAVLTVRRIVFLIFSPYRLGEAQAFFLEFVFGRNDATRFLDRVVNARLCLVPQELWIAIRDMTVVP